MKPSTSNGVTENCNKNQHYVKFSWESIEVICEYGDCFLTFGSIPLFLQHINIHIHGINLNPEAKGIYLQPMCKALFCNHVTSSNIGDEILICNWRNCNADVPNYSEMRRHILFHAHHSRLKCHGRNFIKRKNMAATCQIDNSTSNYIPELPQQFVCAWQDCNDYFENPENFYRHVDLHANDNPRGNKPKVKIQCHWTGCTVKVSSIYRLKEHLRTHTQERVLACPNCGGMFASRTKFYDHMVRQERIPAKKQNKMPLTYQCGYCFKKFRSERLLRDHTRSHVNQYKCPYCDMTTPTPSGLRTHILYRHSEEKPYPCEICDYRAKNQSDLRKHLLSHDPQRIMDCPYEECTYYSQSASALCHHIKSIHTDEGCTYMCHICEETFKRGHYLTRHLLKKHHLQWPSGHCRFRYQKEKDNLYRLQTVRYEWYDVSEPAVSEDKAITSPSNNDVDIDDPVMNSDKVAVLDPSTASSLQYPMNTNTRELPMTSETLPVTSETLPATSEMLPVMMICNDTNIVSSEIEKATANTLLSLAQSSCSTYVMKDQLLGTKNSDTAENIKLISLVTSKEDGSTVIEMAEIIAEG